MTLSQLRYAITVADSRSMNQAAQKLFISQPSLSAAIRELEDEVGIEIFRRTNRGIQVTPDGEEFVGYARQVVEQYALIEARYVDKEKVKKKFGVSMRLGLISAGISLLVGIMLGILQTAFKDKVFDWIGTAYTVFVNAVPSLVSYSLVLVFGSKYLGFPTLYSTRNVGPSSVLPIVCLSLASIAGYALWTRRYMVDELTRDYIKLARVKGLSSSEIMFKHVLRNAMVPMVQYIPQSILLTVGGSLLMERFFSVPGMGPLLTDAIQRYDLNVVQTLVILYAALGIVGVFLGDVLMMLVDPRITLTGKEAAR